MSEAVAATLMTIAGRVSRLTIDRRNPDRFFEERSEIANDLVQAARQLDRGDRKRTLDSGNRQRP